MTALLRIRALGGEIPIEVEGATAEQLRAIAVDVADVLLRSFPELPAATFRGAD